MTDSTTTNYHWSYPTVGADASTWGTTINNALIAIDAQVWANANSALQASSLLGAGAKIASISASFTAGDIPIYASDGSLGNSGYGPGSFDAAGAASAALSSAESYTNSQIAAQGLRIGTIKIWVGGSDPGGAAANGDVWIA